MKTIGLVGARGHTGRELIRLLAGREDLKLGFAVSRAMDGQPVTDMASEAPAGLLFEALSPEEVAKRQCDVVIGVPGGVLQSERLGRQFARQ